MNATPPEAKDEYSRAHGASPGSGGYGGTGQPRVYSAVLAGVLGGGLLGALLLLVAEFTTLYQVHSAASSLVIKSVGTGSNHSYALLPLALLAAFLAFGAWRVGSRPALLGIGIAGVIALLIALLGDLPDAHASGLLGSSATHFTEASSQPSAGFYMETLGAVVLIVTCVSGFVMLGAPVPRRVAYRDPAPPPPEV